MSRRRRALGFLAAAVATAVAAAAIANGYGSSVARGYGPLRPVTVAAQPLEAGEPITPRLAATGLAVRRVPARFVPAGALLDPSQALGLAPQADLPAGGYLLASQLRSPHPAGPASRLSPRRTPVQIAVSGTGPLLAAGRSPGERVDVVVVSEPRGPGPGRAHVAAAGVPLLAISGGGRAGAATLGLTRDEALRLIPAQSFARQVTLLPAPASRPGGR